MRFLSSLFSKKATAEHPVLLPAEGELLYAVGDIHGRADLLDLLLERIEADHQNRVTERCTLVFLGDYVDRGFHSRDVIDRLITLSLPWAEIICLRGNHEDMLLDFMLDPFQNEDWLHFGGLATLASYGVKLEEEADGKPDLLKASKALHDNMPDTHHDFLREIPLSYRSGDYFFVHAGIRPGVPLHAQDPRDLTFIRQEFTQSTRDHGVRVVHGHTGVQNPVVAPNRIAVDTTAYATGCLTAAVIDRTEVAFVTTL